MTQRSRDPLIPLAIMFATAAAVLLLFAGLARAAADPPPAQPLDIGWLGYVGIALAAGGGLVKILEVLLVGLRWLAPRTKTTLDDRARDDLQIVRDDIAAVLKTVGALVPAAGVPTNATSTTAGPVLVKTGSGTAVMFALLLLGALVAPALTACATTKHAVAEGSAAFLECESAHLDAAALADAKAMASAELRHLLTGSKLDTAALKADLAPLKSDLARCGWAAAIAAIGALFPQPSDPEGGVAVSALAAAGPDPAQVRDQARLVMRDLGWPRIKAPGGPVL